MEQLKPKVVRVTTRVVTVGVFLLLIAGALVTSTGSGLAVPDWPLSYGRLMPPMVGGIFYEHGHRIVAAAVSTLVGLQLAIVLWGEKRRTLKTLAATAFAAILLQAILGGLTVIFLLPPAVSSAHAGLAEIVFAMAGSLALLTWQGVADGSAFRPGDATQIADASRLVTLATAVIFVQILLGAVVRHTGAGLAIPDFPLSFGHVLPTGAELARRGVAIHLAHRLGALATAALLVAAALRLRRLGSVSRLFPRLALSWIVLLVAQLALGGFSIWSKRAVPVTAAHLAVGALCFLTGVLGAVALGVAARRGAEPAAASESRARNAA